MRARSVAPAIFGSPSGDTGRYPVGGDGTLDGRRRKRCARRGQSIRRLALAAPLAAVLVLLAATTARADPVYPHRSGVLVAWSPEQWDGAWSAANGHGYKNLDRLKADGFTHVDFQIYNRQDSVDEQNSTLGNVLESPAKRALYVKAIQYAHAIGLKVVLKPHVGGAPQTTSYFPPDPSKFFAAYKGMLDSVAVLAGETRAEMIVIGTELGAKLSSNHWKDRGSTTFDVTNWWRSTMIPSVRAKAPGAQLTYAATSTPHLHTDINANEAPYVTFWDLLDRIGLNGYFKMNNIATRLNVGPTEVTEDHFYAAMHDNGLPWTRENSQINTVFSIANLKAKYTSGTTNQNQMRYFKHIAEGIYKLYGADGSIRSSTTLAPQAIFTEWGVPGADSSLDFWAGNTKTVAAWERQRRGYAAALREFTRLKQDGAGSWFAGTAIWQILPWHDPSSTTSPQAWLLEFDPIGKPAEALIREAYTSGTPVGDTTPPAAPSASPTPGTYTSDQSVSLAAEPGAVIRYTLNGADPTATTGTAYSTPILLTGSVGASTTTTVRAVAIDAAGNVSSAATLGYTIDKSSSPPATRTVVLTATTTHGTQSRMRVDLNDNGATGSQARAYLRFSVSALGAGERITTARLSLQVTDGTDNGPAIWATQTSWTESTMTWNTGRPARVGTTAVGNFAGMPVGRQSVAVSGVTGSGLKSFELMPESTNLVVVASRNDATIANRPQLILTIAGA